MVTDTVERLTDCTDRLSNYLQRNRQHISLLTAETFRDEISSISYRPIVAMTTQRYFSLTRDEIIDLTAYKYGRRETIIFDEKPFFAEIIRIDIEILDSIDGILHSAIDNRDNQTDKQWMIAQWEKVCRYIKGKISYYEERNDGYEYTVYHYDPSCNVLDDPDRLNALLIRWKDKLRKYNYKFDAYKHIAAVLQMLTEGATFTSRKLSKKRKDGTEYCNYFLVLIDNRDKLVDIGAKVFVLDGTADISPEYNVSYIKMIDCKAFRTALDNLSINIVDVRSGKSYLSSKGIGAEQIIDCLISYQNSLPVKDQVLFTYKNLRDRYTDRLQSAYETIDYFGNIRGKNVYRECTNIIQFGLNRFPQSIYNLQSSFSILEHYNKSCICYVGQDYARDIVINSILTDIEQNIFRSKIRNQDCSDGVTYTLMFDVTGYQDLIEAIKSRYEPMGAKVNVLDSPLEFDVLKTVNRKTENSTSAQRVINYYYSLPQGSRFTRRDIMKQCEITVSQFKNAKQNNGVKRILVAAKTDKQGVYIKK